MNTLSIPVKALFIDEPFMEGDSLRAQRSRFIWNVLSMHTDADLLLLKSDIYREQPIPRHDGYDRLYSLSLDTDHLLLPPGYHQLAKNQGKRLSGILDAKRYQLIILAGLKCLPLAYLARKSLPQSVIVLDLDRLYLPDIKQDWTGRQDFGNLPKLWDFLRQRLLDKHFLRNHLKYLCADPGYPDKLKPLSPIPETDRMHLPLPFEASDDALTYPPIQLPNDKYILFWGDPKYKANLQAAKLIAGDIYPRISKKLVERDISIVLCGGDKYQDYCGGRIIHAPLEHWEQLLQGSLFALLPLAEADNEARIYACAKHRKALLCTSPFMQSLPLPEGTHYLGSDPDAMAAAIIHMLRAPKEMEKTGNSLYEHCINSFSPEILTQSLVQTLKTWMNADADQ